MTDKECRSIVKLVLTGMLVMVGLNPNQGDVMAVRNGK